MDAGPPSILALIPARGGSKGVPGKNVAMVGGRPLIAWTIEAAITAQQVERVIVDTDDLRIAAIAREYGAQTPYSRPTELAQDATPSMDVVVHALRWLKAHEAYRPQGLCLLQPTSPLRTAADIDAAIDLAKARAADAVVSVTPTHHHALWQKRLETDGLLRDYIHDATAPTRRQDLAPAYALNGAIYFARSEVLLEHRTWYTPRTFGYVMPEERSLDVDSSWTLHVADLVLSERRDDQQATDR